MSRLATFLLVLCLAVGAAACGDDDEPSGDAGTTATAETQATTDETPTQTEETGTAGGDDEPFEVEARITKIERMGGSDDPADQDAGFVVATAETTDGPTYRVVIPPDVTLDEKADRVLRDPACEGKSLVILELVKAPETETAGDAVLVSAKVDTENC